MRPTLAFRRVVSSRRLHVGLLRVLVEQLRGHARQALALHASRSTHDQLAKRLHLWEVACGWLRVGSRIHEFECCPQAANALGWLFSELATLIPHAPDQCPVIGWQTERIAHLLGEVVSALVRVEVESELAAREIAHA